jgi:mycothiol synthase
MTTLRPAGPRERRAALALLYHYLAADEQSRRLAAVRAAIASDDIDPNGLLVAVARRRIVGAVLAIPLPGAHALLYPPQVVGDDAALAERLLAQSLAWLHARGTRLVQSLASDNDMAHFAALPRAGFAHLGRLWYLHHDLIEIPTPTGPAFRLIPYREAGACFGQSLLASYEGTLDFPELTGLRTLDEILAGHRGSTLHDPRLWWLIEAEGGAAGVAMLGPLPDVGEWDLTYLGLVPAARGRGLGRAILGELLRRACAGSAMRVVLAVDERNLPAWRLYRGAGFVPDEARAVFLKIGLE